MKILIEKTDHNRQTKKKGQAFNRGFWQGEHHQYLRQAYEKLIITRQDEGNIKGRLFTALNARCTH